MTPIENTIAKVENLAGGFNSGNIYSICARPGNDKTHLCLYSAIHLANEGHKTLYLSDSMDIDKFYTKLTNLSETILVNLKSLLKAVAWEYSFQKLFFVPPKMNQDTTLCCQILSLLMKRP